MLKKLNVLAGKIDILTMLIASKPNGEQLKKLFKGKTQKEQIRLLQEWNFPNEISALIIGTTPETVRVTLAKMKSKKRKRNRNLEWTFREISPVLTSFLCKACDSWNPCLSLIS